MKMLYRSIIGLWLGITLIGFTSSCSQSENSSSPSPSTNQESPTIQGVLANDFAPGQLQMHFVKHGYQFGAITESEYLEDARKLLNTPAGKEILEKFRDNGDILHYKPSTGEFAVMTHTGRIRTYFKTNTTYWEKQ